MNDVGFVQELWSFCHIPALLNQLLLAAAFAARARETKAVNLIVKWVVCEESD